MIKHLLLTIFILYTNISQGFYCPVEEGLENFQNLKIVLFVMLIFGFISLFILPNEFKILLKSKKKTIRSLKLFMMLIGTITLIYLPLNSETLYNDFNQENYCNNFDDIH